MTFVVTPEPDVEATFEETGKKRSGPVRAA